MAKKTLNSVKLGVFVIAGLGFLIMLLYVIGKNQNLFGNTFSLKARFQDVHGLMPGNNIRFAGINAGTVKTVEVLNDTTIEVTLLIKTKMKKYIRKNATVSITTDGLMGNRLLNIQSAKTPAPLVEEGDILYSTPGPDTDEMLKVLNKTNNDIAVIASELKQTVQRLNNSKPIWTMLNDESIPANIRHSLSGIKNASGNMERMMVNLNAIVDDVREGKGSVGELLKDTVMADNVREAVDKIRKIGVSADTLAIQINALVNTISNEINNGEGTANAVLKNKVMAERLNNSFKNIESGTRAFNENMEALKHNFLLRGYFRKLDKKKKGQSATVTNY